MKCHQVLFWGFLLGFFLLIETANATSHEELTLLEEQNYVYQGRGKFKCPLPFGAYPDPEDCAHFYVCVLTKATHMKCPANHHFDIFRRVCIHKFVAICGSGNKEAITEKTTSTKRPATTVTDDDSFVCTSVLGTFAHPSDCSKYYKCLMYKRFEKKCGGNELFDAIKKECRPEREVHCGDRRRPAGFTTISKPTETTTKSTTETAPERITTETEVETTTERITPETEVETTTERITPETEVETTRERITPETEVETTTERKTTETAMETTTERIMTEATSGSTADITTKDVATPNLPTPPNHDCDEEDVDCIITETGDVNDWFICPQDVGSYPHPSSDKLFIFCMNWIPSAKKCGLDRFFSKELSTCVDIN